MQSIPTTTTTTTIARAGMSDVAVEFFLEDLEERFIDIELGREVIHSRSSITCPQHETWP